MKLGLDFAITGFVLVLLLVPFYIYRKELYSFFYSKSDFEIFIQEVQKYLKSTHPKINFNFSMIQKTKQQKNPKTRQILIIEDIVTQFTNSSIEIPNYTNPVDKDWLWESYQQNSKPYKNKLPKDWSRRKDIVFKRDKNCCQRCGQKIEFDTSQIMLLKPVKEGGGYNVENLILLCNDCYRVLNSNDLSKTAKSLNIMDKLISKVTNV